MSDCGRAGRREGVREGRRQGGGEWGRDGGIWKEAHTNYFGWKILNI